MLPRVCRQHACIHTATAMFSWHMPCGTCGATCTAPRVLLACYSLRPMPMRLYLCASAYVRMCPCLCAYVPVPMCQYLCAYAYEPIPMCLCAYTYVPMCLCAYSYVPMCLYAYVRIPCDRVRPWFDACARMCGVCVCARVCVRVCVCAGVCVCLRVCV